MPTRQCGHGMSEAAGMEGGGGGSGGSHMEGPASGWARPRNGAGGMGGGPSGRRRQWVFVLRGRAWCRCPMCLLVGGFT